MSQLTAIYNQFFLCVPTLRNAKVRVESNQSELIKGNDPTNEELLIAVGNRQDKAAFNKLFRRFSNRVYAMGMKFTRNDQLANDLVQEALLLIWQKAPLYDLDKGSAQTWIFTLVRNRCFDILRKMKRQPDTIGADDIYSDILPELAVNTDKQQADEIQASEIKQYFDLLPEPQRQVVESLFERDLTHQEAAIELNIPLGTLKSRLRLALNKLREHIGVQA